MLNSLGPAMLSSFVREVLPSVHVLGLLSAANDAIVPFDARRGGLVACGLVDCGLVDWCVS
jgi:hypothetical protein